MEVLVLTNTQSFLVYDLVFFLHTPNWFRGWDEAVIANAYMRMMCSLDHMDVLCCEVSLVPLTLQTLCKVEDHLRGISIPPDAC